MHPSIFRPLALGLLYVTILSCSTKDVVLPTQPSGARATVKSYECDVNQGYNFKQDVHQTFGYITSLSIGDKDINPDIKVVDPNSLGSVMGSASTAGIFSKPVVGVLSNASWSTLPTDNINFSGRISLNNSQTLKLLTQAIGTKRTVIKIDFVVYEYDLVNQVYYTSFKSYAGSLPSGTPKQSGSGIFDASLVYGLLGKNSAGGVGLTIGAKAAADPIGIRNYPFELTLAPAISSAPQQIRIQTSNTIKLIQPWGLPQK